MEFIELNWLCKYTKKVRSSQTAIVMLNSAKHSFSLKLSLSAAKLSNWNGNFSDFIDLQGKNQVWQILSNFTKVCWLYILQLYIAHNFQIVANSRQ